MRHLAIAQNHKDQLHGEANDANYGLDFCL
jgi:hypothetical protein